MYYIVMYVLVGGYEKMFLQLMTFGNPYFLLICSEQLRQAVMGWLGKKKKNKVNVIVVPPKKEAKGTAKVAISRL